MTERYQNKYRITSTRLQNWNYGWNAAYFVTINTQNREHYFGEIVDSIIQLSEIGRLANKYWLEIPQHFPFVELDAFVVMPNHVHGIIIINKLGDTQNLEMQDTHDIRDIHDVKTQDFASLRTERQNQFGSQSKNLASIVRGFKIGVTKHARKIDPTFAWQSRYHDHIIRTDESYQNISEYILTNPENWKQDKFYK